MKSVITYEQCPCCTGVVVNDYRYKTGEEFKNCQRCGYTSNFTKENELTFSEETTNGFGFYRITSKSGASYGGPLSAPLKDDNLEAFRAIFEKDDIDKRSSYVTRYENEKVEVLLGDNDFLLSFNEYKIEKRIPA